MSSNSNPISPKVNAAALGSAVATILWFVLSLVGVLPDDTDPEVASAVTGATAIVLAWIFGYFVKDPLRQTG